MYEEEFAFMLEHDRIAMRVKVSIDQVIVPPLLSSKSKADARLNELSILKFSQGTNFEVRQEEVVVLDQ